MQTRGAASVFFWSSAVALLLTTALPTPAVSCDTPVSRYAMYNWPRSPFYIVYFHRGEISEQDAAANMLLEEMAEIGPTGPNLAFKAIDVTDEEQLKQIPEFFNEARKELVKGDAPTHMIFPPWYTDPMVERLDKAAVKKLADSPMRKQIGELFNEGNTTILLILTGPDKKANAKAEKVAAEVVKAAATGEVPMAEDADFYYEEPAAPTSGDSADEDAAADNEADTEAKQEEEEEAEPKLKVAVLKVARTDPVEQWLVRTLLSVESDLRDPEFEKDAMVFAIYGRGRAMPPYVGKGITTDNLIECVAFLAGPCSCMVKDQNPGVDLLTTWDWDATAEIIAKDDPSLDPDPWDYQEYAQNDQGDWSEAESTDTEPTDTEPTDTEPADTEPADTEPADTEPADTEPADTESAEQPIDDTPPAEETSVEEMPAEKPPVEEPPVEVTPDEVTPDEVTPDEETPDEVTPDEVTPDEETPDEETPDEETPDEETPDEETPDEETPDEETPDEETPDEETPTTAVTEETPDDDVPGRNPAEVETQLAEEGSQAEELDVPTQGEEVMARSFASRQAWVIGLGLAAGALLVVVVGLAMTGRKQS